MKSCYQVQGTTEDIFKHARIKNLLLPSLTFPGTLGKYALLEQERQRQVLGKEAKGKTKMTAIWQTEERSAPGEYFQ